MGQLEPNAEALMQRIRMAPLTPRGGPSSGRRSRKRIAHEGYLVKFLDREAAETHCPVGILTYVMDYPFFDTDDEITKALMRLEIVKPLHHDMTMVGVSSKIVYGPVLILDNTQPPPYADPDEAEEYEEMEWSDEEPVEWNIFNDRTLIQSLIRNGHSL